MIAARHDPPKQSELITEPKDGLIPQISTAIGECVVAQMLGKVFPDEMGDYGIGDVGTKQVRLSPGIDDKLILYKDDKADKIFILVTGGDFDAVGQTFAFLVCGWIVCRDGWQERWWCPSRQAYFVPQEDLKDIRSLPS